VEIWGSFMESQGSFAEIQGFFVTNMALLNPQDFAVEIWGSFMGLQGSLAEIQGPFVETHGSFWRQRALLRMYRALVRKYAC